jgi:hypothetical protein
MKHPGTFLLAIMLSQSLAIQADDVRVLFVDALGAEDPAGPCYQQWPSPGSQLRWRSDVLFFNRSSEPLPVLLLGISNGGHTEPGRSMTLAPQTAVSLSLHEAGRLWRPSGSPIAVLHLDVPAAVSVSSRLDMGALHNCVSAGPFNADYGSLSLPLFRRLVPANEPQVHLVADRGSLPARINVGVFNAGTIPASAHVELREACGDRVLATRDVVIPGDTLIQVEGLKAKDTEDCPHGLLSDPVRPKAYSWANYVLVTISEPSLSYVSSIADDQFPRGTLGVAGP